MEVAGQKASVNEKDLEKFPSFKRATFSLKDFLFKKNTTKIIAEFKRRSPSKGMINGHSTVEEVTAGYTKYGASALSVLTDATFFGGSLKDLQSARVNDVPILRKEFIIDPYQILESKAHGADIILLIAACLSAEEVKSLSHFAKNIGLQILLEIHEERELESICDDVDVVGINNRDLKTFKVDLNHSIELCKKIPSDKIAISESGISNVDTIRYLKQHGFSGFLMGERFMKEQDPVWEFKNFAKGLVE